MQYKIQCPKCHIIYTINKLEDKPVTCKQVGCNHTYMQGVHQINNIWWIRKLAVDYTCKDITC